MSTTGERRAGRAIRNGRPAAQKEPVDHVQRKQDHLRIVVDEAVGALGVTTGLERYRLMHRALPELDLVAIDMGTQFLGHELRVPLLISGMTGGVERGAEINRRLAAAAQAVGCAMGVGSQRVALEDPSLAPTFRVRDVAPDILLFANLGAVQLNYGYGLDQCRRAVEMIDANALVLHLNPLQEALQVGGNTNWVGILRRIESVCAKLEVPVIVKEVGWGISADVARQLVDVGVAAIDIGGAGGTSWSEVERHRAPTDQLRRVAGAFGAWGIPTADSVVMVRTVAPNVPLVASGGLRSGVEAATALALGADLVGFAAPLLRAAAESETGAHQMLTALVDELRVSMFCCGAGDLGQLKQVEIMSSSLMR
jgi:isopentenyl-diphosphate delta-isomerase